MDYVVVFKPRIWEGQVLSTLLQADKTQEATRAFSIAATILLQLPDIPLPLTFAKDTGHSQSMVSDPSQNQWNQWISSVIDYVQFENHHWALAQIKTQYTVMDFFILIFGALYFYRWSLLPC